MQDCNARDTRDAAATQPLTPPCPAAQVALITAKIPEGGYTTAYRCGPLIDLCRGPHVPTTGAIKAFEVTKTSSAYWLGNVDNDTLQRVYGVSFPDVKLMKAHLTMVRRRAGGSGSPLEAPSRAHPVDPPLP